MKPPEEEEGETSPTISATQTKKSTRYTIMLRREASMPLLAAVSLLLLLLLPVASAIPGYYGGYLPRKPVEVTNEGIYKSPRIVILGGEILKSRENINRNYSSNRFFFLSGATGVGKSSLANVLLGRDKNYDGRGHANGCFKVMGLNNGGTSVTKETCPDTGHMLGNTSRPLFTVIDTPGSRARTNFEINFVWSAHGVFPDEKSYLTGNKNNLRDRDRKGRQK